LQENAKEGFDAVTLVFSLSSDGTWDLVSSRRDVNSTVHSVQWLATTPEDTSHHGKLALVMD
jgi:hypothetical protein